MLKVGIWVVSFGCAGILLLQWQCENVAHRQLLKFCHFQPVHCASRNPISPKIFNQFSKSFAQLEEVDVVHLGRKFQVRRNFTLAMARWKLCASTTVEILSLSTCTLCPQNSYISKGIPPIFEIFASARTYWGWAFGWKVSRGQVFDICNGQVKTLRIDNIWNFATINLYTLPAKTYISKGIPLIFEIFASVRRCWRWAFGWEVSAAQVFYFCNGKVKLCASTTFEILLLSTCTVCQQKSYISKDIQPIVEIFASARRCWGWALEWKVSGAQVFYFCNGKVKICASTTFEVLLLSTCTLCQQNSYICKGIQPIFEIFPSARRCWGWAIGWKVSGGQVFYFCNGNVKTLRIDNIWGFATFKKETVPAKILCLQRYSIDFRNLSVNPKRLRVGIWVESFRCAGILLLQWQGENFAHRQHLKFCYFQPVHCASRNPISPKIFNQFSKSFPQLEDVDDGHLGRKFHVRRYFTFAIARWKLCTSTTYEILPLSSCTLCKQKSYISKGIQPISKSSPQLEDIEGGHLGGKFHVGRYFTFAIARCKLCASTTFEILPLSTCTLCNQNSYICKGIEPIFEMFPSARRCWGWAFGWKVSCVQVFYFCNCKVKTLHIDNIWNFATFTLYTVQAEILYL